MANYKDIQIFFSKLAEFDWKMYELEEMKNKKYRNLKYCKI